MAGTTQDVKRQYAEGDTELLKVLVAEYNKVITDLETLRAAVDTIADQLDADGGVTDTDYAANAAVATAATMTAASLNVV